FSKGEMNLHLGQPEAREPSCENLFGRSLLQVGPPRLLLPVAAEDSRDPVGHLILEEANVLEGIVAASRYRIPLEVGPAARIDNVHEDARLSKVVKELVPEPASLMGFRHEAGHIDHFDGNQARAVLTGRVLRIAGPTQFDMGTPPPDIGHTMVRLD